MVVKDVFQMYCRDKLSIGAIARELNKKEVTTKKQQGIWERSTIWSMLRNPAYYGQAAFRKTVRVERLRPTKLARDNTFYPKSPKSSPRDRDKKDWIYISVPAIISPETFQIASEQLEANKKLSLRNNKKYKYLLSGLLRCKECGYSIYGKPVSNSKYKRCYYRCMGQDGYRWPSRGRVCSSHPLRVEILDDLVWEQTVKLIEEPQAVINEYTNRIHEQKDGQQSLTKLILKKSLEVRQIKHEKERLLDLYQNGTLGLSEIEPRLKKIREKRKQLEIEEKSLEHERKQKGEQLQLVDQLQEFQKKVSANLNTLGFEQKKEIVRLLVKEVEVNIKTSEVIVRHVVPIPEKLPLCPGSTYCTLRCALARIYQNPFVHDPCVQPFGY